MFRGSVSDRARRQVIRAAVMGVLAVILLASRGAEGKDITLPLTVDYPLLRALVIQSFFSGPDQQTILLDEADGCRKIVVSNPIFRAESSSLFFEIKVFVRLGVMVFNNCFSPVEWEGYLVMQQEPVISDQWNLSFVTRTSSVYDKERKPARVAGVIWNFANPPILDYLRKITVDLAAPVDEIRSFLLPLFPPNAKKRTDRFLESMRPGTAGVTPTALRIAVHAEVEEVHETAGERETLTSEEKALLVETWEALDAFLVQIITALAGKALTPYERGIFLDTLLEMRYRFVEDLDRDMGGRDLVREEFVQAWTRLSPVFRSHLTEGSTRSLLGYLGFLAGGDALVALDTLGPSLGIEISRDGLIRLARLLIKETPVSLAYGYDLDQPLRQTLGLGPSPVPSFPIAEEPDSDDLRIPEEPPLTDESWAPDMQLTLRRLFHLLKASFLSPAWAENQAQEKWTEEIRSWVPPPKTDLLPYIERVRGLLDSASEQVLTKGKLPETYHGCFRRLVMATGWQESCCRQFLVKKGAMTYLRSYNGTSVGLMQINERVWRGLYAEKSLRWDIRYNAVAGCEILDLYLRRYALKKIRAPEGEQRVPANDLLAEAVYAIYNAGPGVLHAFLKRSQQGVFTNLDRLFDEKLQWVKNQDWEQISRCY